MGVIVGQFQNQRDLLFGAHIQGKIVTIGHTEALEKHHLGIKLINPFVGFGIVRLFPHAVFEIDRHGVAGLRKHVEHPSHQRRFGGSRRHRFDDLGGVIGRARPPRQHVILRIYVVIIADFRIAVAAGIGKLRYILPRISLKERGQRLAVVGGLAEGCRSDHQHPR